MAASNEASAEFYGNLGKNITNELTYNGELSAETLQFWNAVGYDEDAANAASDILQRNPMDYSFGRIIPKVKR